MYIEILSESDVKELQNKSIVLRESNSGQIYEANIIKKIKEKMSGKIGALKKILKQAGIKIADFFIWVKNNLSKIKFIKIINLKSLVNEQKKIIKTGFLNEKNISIVQNISQEDLDQIKNNKELKAFNLEKISDIENLDKKEKQKFADVVKDFKSKDKFKNTLLQNINANKLLKKGINFICLIGVVGSIAASMSSFDMYAADRSNGSIHLVNTETAEISPFKIAVDTVGSGDIGTTGNKIEAYNATKYKISSEEIEKFSSSLGDIVKTVEKAIFFEFSDNLKNAVKEAANKSVKEFNNSKEDFLVSNQKINLYGKQRNTTTILLNFNKGFSLKNNKFVVSEDAKRFVENSFSSFLNKAKKFFSNSSLAELEEDLEFCKSQFFEGDAGGITCVFTPEIEEKLFENDILPPIIASGNKEDYFLLETVRHEFGHLISDGDIFTEVIDNIINEFTKIKKENKSLNITTENFQKLILKNFVIYDKYKKRISFSELGKQETKEVKNFIKLIVGQMLLFDQISLQEDQTIKIKAFNLDKTSEYINQNNEARQNLLDLFYLFEKSIEKDIVEDIKNNLKALNKVKLKLKNKKLNKNQKYFYETIKYYLQSGDLSKEQFKWINSANISIKDENIRKAFLFLKNSRNNEIYKLVWEKTFIMSNINKETNFLKIFDRYYKVFESLSNNKKIFSLISMKDKSHDHHDHHDHHKHESFSRIRQSVYSKLLRELSYNYS